jgi:hypothetical protein
MEMRVICVGYTTTVVSGVEQLMAPISPPARWKDPEKINEYLIDKQAEQQKGASMRTLTGAFKEIVAVCDGKVVEGIDWSVTPVVEMLFGYDMIAIIEANLFRSLAIADKIDKRGQLSEEDLFLVTSQRSGLPYLMNKDEGYRPTLFDPVHAITGSSAAESNDLSVVSRRFKLPAPKVEALSLAMFTFGLCAKLGIVNA